MKEAIRNAIDQPQALEQLYRNQPAEFKKSFNLLYPEIADKTTAQVWYQRLNFASEPSPLWDNKKELILVIVLGLLAAIIAKLPDIFHFKEEDFYARNMSFIVFPVLMVYFSWKKQLASKKNILLALATLGGLIFINLLPQQTNSNTLMLTCIHLPLFFWAMTGFTYIGGNLRSVQSKIDFLRFNGDLLVMMAVILIAGGLLTGITIGLFSLIQIDISRFYFRYIVVGGLAASPIVGTYLVCNIPQLVNKVPPIIAKVFSPLVLITLAVYLVAVLQSGKNPYNDREFLIVFNALLIGVMAIILFFIAEFPRNSGSKISVLLLLALTVLTLVVNGVALSAIIFRIVEWGITPNRLAVLGSNLLIFANLTMVTYRLYTALKNPQGITQVEQSIAYFLPLYTCWFLIVSLFFPFIFSFN